MGGVVLLASKTQEAEKLTRYVLGGLDEREGERLEAEYFDDDDAFEQLLIAEEELTDAYARGELSGEERARFEACYLSTPRGRERVQFSRDLARAASESMRERATHAADAPAPESPLFAAARTNVAVWRFAFAAVALAVVAGLAWLLVERARMKDELRQLRAERVTLGESVRELERRADAEHARSEELLAQLEGERARPTPQNAQRGDDDTAPRNRPPTVESRTRSSVASFVLTPGLVRGGGGTTLRVPRGASTVALRLNVEGESYESYRAVIETAGGQRVWAADFNRPRRAGGSLALPPVPARDLPPADYVLLLSGKRQGGEFESVADYSFRVLKE